MRHIISAALFARAAATTVSAQTAKSAMVDSMNHPVQRAAVVSDSATKAAPPVMRSAKVAKAKLTAR